MIRHPRQVRVRPGLSPGRRIPRGPAAWSILITGVGLALLATYEPAQNVSSAAPQISVPRSVVLSQLGLPAAGPGLTQDLVAAPPASRTPLTRPHLPGQHLSAYDELIWQHAEARGLDWRLVAALIYEESQFNPRAVSSSGAVGLMQVMPQFTELSADSLLDPHTNLLAGLRLLNSTYGSFAYLDSLDRIRFTLAVYHAGLGHMNDARRIAMDLGLDPNRWTDAVAVTLPKLSDPRWSRLIRHGFYRGGDTIRFVNETLARFEANCRRVSRGSPREVPADPAVVARGLASAPGS